MAAQMPDPIELNPGTGKESRWSVAHAQIVQRDRQVLAEVGGEHGVGRAAAVEGQHDVGGGELARSATGSIGVFRSVPVDVARGMGLRTAMLEHAPDHGVDRPHQAEVDGIVPSHLRGVDVDLHERALRP